MELSCSALVDSRQTTGPQCARGLTSDTSLASTISASWAFGSMSSPGIEELQELHYDRISPQYELHYGDPCSQEYRDRFINQPMFAGIDLHGLDVLEAMCSNGQTTEFLLSRGARVTGLDISQPPRSIPSSNAGRAAMPPAARCLVLVLLTGEAL